MPGTKGRVEWGVIVIDVEFFFRGDENVPGDYTSL